jgi:hypothetical protein
MGGRQFRQRLRGLDARAASRIRIDAMWLAAGPIDMRACADRLLACVVQVFGAAQAHHGYLFANARGTCIKFSCTTALASGARHASTTRAASPGYRPP